MTKIKDILIRTVLPTTIGTVVLMSYFILLDRMTPRQIVESCSDFYISNSDYLIFILVIAGLGSIFKLTADNILENKLTNAGTFRHVISILIFASFFELIFLILEMLNDNPPDLLLEVLVIAIILGTIIEILSWTVENTIVKPDNSI
jgi:hypothetical protein